MRSPRPFFLFSLFSICVLFAGPRLSGFLYVFWRAIRLTLLLTNFRHLLFSSIGSLAGIPDSPKQYSCDGTIFVNAQFYPIDVYQLDILLNYCGRFTVLSHDVLMYPKGLIFTRHIRIALSCRFCSTRRAIARHLRFSKINCERYYHYQVSKMNCLALANIKRHTRIVFYPCYAPFIQQRSRYS